MRILQQKTAMIVIVKMRLMKTWVSKVINWYDTLAPLLLGVPPLVQHTPHETVNELTDFSK